MSILDNLKGLTSIPPSGILSARRNSKLQFLQLEGVFLRKYSSSLSQNLRFYKEMINDCLTFQSANNHSDLATPNCLQDTLLAQNRVLQHSLNQLNIETSEAKFNEEKNYENQVTAKQNEDSTLQRYEHTFQALVHSAKQKEQEIRALESEISSIEVPVVYSKFSANLTEEEQLKLLDSKRALVQSIGQDSKELLNTVRSDNNFLTGRYIELKTHFRALNDMLLHPQDDKINLNLEDYPRTNTTCDEFPVQRDNSNLVTTKPKETAGIKLLEGKLEKFTRLQREYQLKMQMATHEISNANRLQGQLMVDSANVCWRLEKDSRNRIQTAQDPSDAPSFSLARRPRERTREVKRSNSNPLDYTECRAYCEFLPKGKGAINTQEGESSLEYDYGDEVSKIQESMTNSEICGDSVIIGIFELSVG